MNAKRSILAAALALTAAILILPAAHGIAADQGTSSTLRVAILPVVNGTSEVDAVTILEDVISQRLKEVDRSRAIFLMPGDVERTLTAANAMDRAYRITDKWSKKEGALDSTALAGLDSILVVDAVMCVQIFEWERKRFHNINEGQSFSTVGLRFTLFGIKDRKRVWTKEVREQRLADEIDVTSGSYSFDATGRYQNPTANEPPRIQDVAADLIRSAFKKFPVK